MTELIPANPDFINDFSISTLSDLHNTASRLRSKQFEEPLTTYEKALIKLHQAVQEDHPNIIDLSQSGLDILPREIEILSSRLIELNLSSNNLSSLPPSLVTLKKLKRLDLDNNRFSHLPPEISSLRHLESLSIKNNYLTELPAELGALLRLKNLDIRNNRLRTLPFSIKSLMYLDQLLLDNNEFKVPPEISARPTREVILFILQSAAQGTRSISEAKVLFVGEGGVGKTSIVKRVTENTFNEYEQKTEGILIKNWHVDVNGNWIRLNVWDFGGQEIMHATHQFFLTERSVYVLVWDARQEDDYGQLEYWLNIINSFGNKAPVVVVLNKIDVGQTEIDRRGLQSKFPSIRAFVNCSCKTGRGIEELKDLVCWHARQLTHTTTTWPAKWFLVKDQLERTNKDYISLTEYGALCQRTGINQRDDRVNLLQFLHDLGIVLSFHKDARLCDTNVLNPEWATGGVYKILNDPKLFGRGLLELEDIGRILDDSRYPRQKHGFIINLMQKFELCYQIDDGKHTVRFLIPDLITKQQPFFKWDFRYSLGFQYHYNFLPSSIISRFIVRMHHLIDKNFVWRTGVILRDSQNRALIRGDMTAKRVYIDIDGLQTTRRDLLAKIRATFEHIHRTVPRIEGTAKVPLPENHSIVVDYQHLLDLESLGEKDFIPEGFRRRVKVYDLLVGVRKPPQRGTKNVQEEKAKGVEISIVNTFTGIERGDVVSIERENRIQAGRDISINQSQLLFETVKSNVTGHIGNIPTNLTEVRRCLEDLKNVIEQDPILPESEKVVALEKTGFLAQLASKTVKATEQLVEDSIRAIRGTIVEGSSHLFETGKELLSQISKEILG